MTVQHGHTRTLKTRPETLHRLRSQGDFRHENQTAFSRFQDAGKGAQIDLRLAASRDTMQEERHGNRSAGFHQITGIMKLPHHPILIRIKLWNGAGKDFLLLAGKGGSSLLLH